MSGMDVARVSFSDRASTALILADAASAGVPPTQTWKSTSACGAAAAVSAAMFCESTVSPPIRYVAAP
jgi:hypothetical protein